MRDCVAPRLVHMLDAMFNGLVIEQLAAVSDPRSVTLTAVDDAWIVVARNDAAWRSLETKADAASAAERSAWSAPGRCGIPGQYAADVLCQGALADPTVAHRRRQRVQGAF
jgi:hypothetical protein